MLFYKQFAYIVFFILLFTSSFHLFTYAQETPTPSPTTAATPNVDKKQQEIKELEKKVTELKTQSNTLSSQIQVMDGQIKLTQLRIAATQLQVDELTGDIEITSKKIAKLESSLNDLTKVLLNRIVATYEQGSLSSLDILLSSGGVPDFFSRLNYLRIVQQHDKQLILETQQAKNDYANQKNILEDKKQKVVTLQTQLEGYTKQLDSDKKNKENLLAVTKNSEKEYQRRLADALRELQQIQSAAKFLVDQTPRDVNRGDAIGLMGNTGYSFGAHLHFGIYSASSLAQYNYYSGYENPANYLQSASVDWATGCGGDPKGGSNTGSGSFAWPMDTGGLHITQGFGHTCYSDVYYRGNPHPAYDMYNNSNIVVHAIESGKAYFCRNCTGDGGNGVFIFHANGKMSLYWHLQ